jgi:hypothetical protein
MTDREFAELLQRTPRTLSAQEVDRIEHEHDVQRGEWVGNQVDHHEYGESRH